MTDTEWAATPRFKLGLGYEQSTPGLYVCDLKGNVVASDDVEPTEWTAAALEGAEITPVSTYRRIPTHIAAKHPAVDLIKCMLMRRGDNEGVAQGRGIALVEALIDTGMLREDGDFLPYDHGRGIINIEEPKP